MIFLKSPYTLLFGINIILIALAYNGFFEGKDLLPIIIAIVTTLGAVSYLFLKRKAPLRPKLIGLLAVLISSFGLYYAHFNGFLAERMRVSQESSIDLLKKEKAPELSFVSSINHKDSLAAEAIILNNKFTIVNFWATWCAPCLKEMPILEEFYRTNKNSKVGIIGFTDYKPRDNDELAKINSLIKKLNISYPILIDSSKQVRSQYKADILPATLLIDSKGEVIDYQIGVNGAEQIMNFVANEIKE